MTKEENEQLIKARIEKHDITSKIKRIVDNFVKVDTEPYKNYQEFIGEVAICKNAVDNNDNLDLCIKEIVDYCNGFFSNGFADDKPNMERKKNHAIYSIYCLIKALIDLLIALKRFDKWEKQK